MNGKPPYAPFKPPASLPKSTPPCPIPTKDADLERLLEKLDHIASDVERVSVHIAERLGLDLDDDGEESGDTEELEDSSDESKAL